jgi:hypothetical protein
MQVLIFYFLGYRPSILHPLPPAHTLTRVLLSTQALETPQLLMSPQIPFYLMSPSGDIKRQGYLLLGKIAPQPPIFPPHLGKGDLFTRFSPEEELEQVAVTPLPSKV